MKFFSALSNTSFAIAFLALCFVSSPVHAQSPSARQLEAEQALFTKNYQKAYDLTFPGCENGVQNDCAILARLYSRGKVVEKSSQKAVKLMTEACMAGSVIGCTNLARLHLSGDGVEKDVLKALNLFSNACSQDYSRACSNLGVEYLNGGNVSTDFVKALEYIKKSCDLGNNTGCSNLGIIYRDGKGVSKDILIAANLFQKSCDMQSEYGCRNLADIYFEGNGISVDLAKAAQYYEKACALSDGASCEKLAEHYRKGEGVSRDMAKFDLFRSRACRNENLEVCKKIAEDASEVLLSGKIKLGGQELSNLTKMQEAIQKVCSEGDAAFCEAYARIEPVRQDAVACQMGDGQVCLNLGSKYSRLDGDASGIDFFLEFRLFLLSCEKGSIIGCKQTYNWFYNSPLHPNVASNFRRDNSEIRRFVEQQIAELAVASCEKNVLADCYDAGRYYVKKSSETKEEADFRKVSFFEKACQGDVAAACGTFAYYSGFVDDFPRDLVKAYDAAAKACSLSSGNFDGCRYLIALSLDSSTRKFDAQLLSQTYDKMCRLDAEKCKNYELVRSWEVEKRTCQNGVSGESCLRIAGLYKQLPQTRDNNATIMSFASKSCELGTIEGCREWARFYEDKDIPAYVSVLERACRLSDWSSCVNAADEYVSGDKIGRDYSKALNLYSRSCNNSGNALGCYGLGGMYYVGRGVNIDKRRALDLYGKSCAQAKNSDSFSEFSAACLSLGSFEW